MKVAQLRLTLIVHGILQARILEWMDSLSLLQMIYPTQGSNQGLPHCRWILYQLSHQGRPMLVRSCLKSCRLGFSIMGTKNFQMSKLGLEKEEEVKWSESHSFVSDSLWPHGLYSPWNSLGQDTGVGRVSFSRGSSQLRDRTQVSCIAGGLYQLSHKESPKTEKLEIKLPTFAGL